MYTYTYLQTIGRKTVTYFVDHWCLSYWVIGNKWGEKPVINGTNSDPVDLYILMWIFVWLFDYVRQVLAHLPSDKDMREGDFTVTKADAEIMGGFWWFGCSLFR
jgi:hypothetical protein